jgi:hypothetical protein
MKKLCIATLVTLIPLALFAQQAPADRPADNQSELLKSFKLSDAQIAQVRDIEKSTRSAIQSDLAHLQLLNAQIKVALPPANANPDLQAVDKLIDQKSQLRAEMEKSFVSAEVQLLQIMGKDNFDKYARLYGKRLPRGAFLGEGMGRFGRGPMGGSPEGDGGSTMPQ